LHDSIVEAVESGHSLRQVAAVAGVSHERIRQVLHLDGVPIRLEFGLEIPCRDLLRQFG
jgi:hypothetical protein